MSVRIHVAPVFAPARIHEQIPGELFMYSFRARVYKGRRDMSVNNDLMISGAMNGSEVS